MRLGRSSRLPRCLSDLPSGHFEIERMGPSHRTQDENISVNRQGSSDFVDLEASSVPRRSRRSGTGVSCGLDIPKEPGRDAALKKMAWN